MNARADAKEQALQAARAQDQEAAAQREQALRDEAESVAAKHKAALAAAQASSHLDGGTLVKSTERRVASEYESHIRTLKVCRSECFRGFGAGVAYEVSSYSHTKGCMLQGKLSLSCLLDLYRHCIPARQPTRLRQGALGKK